MLRTWIRGDGTEYSPSALPALWRRWTDRTSWEKAFDDFGLLHETYGPPEEWHALHRLLAAVTDHWQPAAQNEAIYQPADLLLTWRSAEAHMIRQEVEQAIADRSLFAWVALGRFGPALVAGSLRVHLLADCALALDNGTRYRRCTHCGEWFTPERVDALFCSNACRQAAYAGRRLGMDE